MFNIHRHKQFSNSTIRNSNNMNPIGHQIHLLIGNGTLFLYPDFVCGGHRRRVYSKKKGAKHGHEKSMILMTTLRGMWCGAPVECCQCDNVANTNTVSFKFVTQLSQLKISQPSQPHIFQFS